HTVHCSTVLKGDIDFITAIDGKRGKGTSCSTDCGGCTQRYPGRAIVFEDRHHPANAIGYNGYVTRAIGSNFNVRILQFANCYVGAYACPGSAIVAHDCTYGHVVSIGKRKINGVAKPEAEGTVMRDARCKACVANGGPLGAGIFHYSSLAGRQPFIVKGNVHGIV